jgi:hypothetical protein
MIQVGSGRMCGEIKLMIKTHTTGISTTNPAPDHSPDPAFNSPPCVFRLTV